MAEQDEDKLKVTQISGFEGMFALMKDAERAHGGTAEAAAKTPSPLDAFPEVEEVAPLAMKTCAVCAATNEGDRDVCWNCGASLRRVR